MIRRPPRSTRTDTLFPYTTLFRSQIADHAGLRDQGFDQRRRFAAGLAPDDAVAALQVSGQIDLTGFNDLHCTRPASLSNCCARARYGRSRSEEHTSELQSLMRISYAVFCLKKKTKINNYHTD